MEWIDIVVQGYEAGPEYGDVHTMMLIFPNREKALKHMREFGGLALQITAEQLHEFPISRAYDQYGYTSFSDFHHCINDNLDLAGAKARSDEVGGHHHVFVSFIIEGQPTPENCAWTTPISERIGKE